MPATLPLRVDPVADALASIDAPPFALDAALRLQLGGADPRSALELHVSAVADDLRREAPEAMNGAPARSGVPSDDASALAAHLRAKHRTRATEPKYHARRLAESRRALARIARLDRFTAERLAAGDDPAEATLRVLRFVRAAWSEVPGGMDGAPEAAPTLAEFVAAHVAHAERLRARQSDTPSGKRATKPTREHRKPEEPTPPVSLAFAARELFRLPEAALRGMRKRNEVKWDRLGSELWTFDRKEVEDANAAAINRIDAIAARFVERRSDAKRRSATSPKAAEARAARARRKPGR
ncbi:MAG: hypothetical protein DYG92_08820 [Leptolyngbya sp. PLA1]|nr:hypothetical protein [Leptolyngbya sp. PLA1]